MRQWTGIVCVCIILAVTVGAAGPRAQGGAPLKWFKGNTHTHSLNSDGDSAPDEVVRWYREQKYQFLFFTDHNMVTPIEGLNDVFAMPERFLLIRGEEVTDQAAGKPVHLNMLGGEGVVPPQGGEGVAEALRRNVAAITGARGVISINHPNFGWAMSAADLAGGKGAHLIEIHNGHFMVNNAGGGGQPGAEALWDEMLSAGIRIFGVASDDMHQLKQPWVKTSARPGQGWVVVRSARLTSEAILSALAAGEFYASTGVELSDMQATPQRLTVTVKEQSFAKCTTSPAPKATCGRRSSTRTVRSPGRSPCSSRSGDGAGAGAGGGRHDPRHTAPGRSGVHLEGQGTLLPWFPGARIHMTTTQLLPPAEALALQALISPTEHGIASRILAKTSGGNVTLFAFDAGQGLTEHTSPFDAYVMVLEGSLVVTIGGQPVRATPGTIVRMPAAVPHGLEAPAPARMLLIMLREAAGA
jgi:quercetin dioxygenase-like cupin family protein